MVREFVQRLALTDEQVWEIRDLHARGELNAHQKARELHVSPATVRARLQESELYPRYETLKEARLSDWLRKVARS